MNQDEGSAPQLVKVKQERRLLFCTQSVLEAVFTVVKEKPEPLQSIVDGLLHQPRMKAAAAWWVEEEEN